MNMQIRTILPCPNQQQQKQKKTPFDCYNLGHARGCYNNYGPYFIKKSKKFNAKYI